MYDYYFREKSSDGKHFIAQYQSLWIMNFNLRDILICVFITIFLLAPDILPPILILVTLALMRCIFSILLYEALMGHNTIAYILHIAELLASDHSFSFFQIKQSNITWINSGIFFLVSVTKFLIEMFSNSLNRFLDELYMFCFSLGFVR